jgi:hypothetical protein
MKKQITWKTQTGLNVIATVELITEEIINLDGDKCTVKCCKKNMTVVVDGIGNQGSWIQQLPSPFEKNGVTFVAKVGKLELTQEQVDNLSALNAQIEATPEWQAKLEAQKQAEKAEQEYENHSAKMRKLMAE